MTRGEALRTAHEYLLGRRFDRALEAAEPWRADPGGGRLLHALALAGSGDVAGAAPLLAGIAAAHPASRHPVLDLLSLVPPALGIAHLRAALEHRPDDPALLEALGVLLAESGRAEPALDAFDRVTAQRPADPAAWSNQAKTLATLGRFDEADAAFATACRLEPANPRIGYNRAVTLLKAGRYEAGWAALRIRHELPRRPPPLPGRRLRTLEVDGRTVLLGHDEGFGDTLMLIRYARLLAERGARIVAAMPPALLRIVATAPGVSAVVPLNLLPAYDYWAPLLDVPALFGEPIPDAVPYLRAIAPGPALPPGRKIGLVWAGDPKHALDRLRSVPVEALEPLRAVAGVTWVSLQKGGAAPDWMLDPMPTMRDFADTASIVAQLDAVVSVDTAVAHLAGALGTQVLLMDRFDACWRWLSGREDSVWYPTLRIVRQAQPGDWAGVVDRVARLLAAGADRGWVLNR